jgi:hypothetical protein
LAYFSHIASVTDVAFIPRSGDVVNLAGYCPSGTQALAAALLFLISSSVAACRLFAGFAILILFDLFGIF